MRYLYSPGEKVATLARMLQGYRQKEIICDFYDRLGEHAVEMEGSGLMGLTDVWMVLSFERKKLLQGKK